MSTLWVTEFVGVGNKGMNGGNSDYPAVPPIGTQTVTYTTTAATANAFSDACSHVAISASAAAHIKFGQAPVATTGDMRIEGTIYVAAEFGVYRVEGDRLVPLQFDRLP